MEPTKFDNAECAKLQRESLNCLISTLQCRVVPNKRRIHSPAIAIAALLAYR
ncbi:hypothetical protein PI124_g19651 [Phytophthora idaei]|nr:hypothetical protein PI124_g19651 [Phytophthora idaei]